MKIPAIIIILALLLATQVHSQEEPSEFAPLTDSVVLNDGNISIHLENVDLTTLLRFFSEAGGLNIIAGPEVSSTVSVNLQEVPLLEALDAVLGIAGFTHYQVGSIIFVTTEANKPALPSSVQDLKIKIFRINHVDPIEILPTIQELLDTSGNVWLNPGNTLVVKASEPHMSMIADLLDQLDVPPQQVLIKVKIINVLRDDNLSIGVGFDTLPFTPFGLEVISSGFANPFLPVDGGTTPSNQTKQATPNITSSGLFAGTLQNDNRIFLEALDEASDIEILASPEILVLDGQMARLQVGARLGFRVTTTINQVTSESVEFLEVGTVLTVTPKISDDGLVELLINPKVSSGAIDSATGLPTESTTEVSTTMLVRHGETIIIGGLLNGSRQRIRSQIPFLGDIPILGKLFGRRRWIDDESEVVVLITPYIMDSTPPLEMRERVNAALGRWGEFGEKGLVRDEIPFPKESPTTRWSNRFKKRSKGKAQQESPSGQSKTETTEEN